MSAWPSKAVALRLANSFAIRDAAGTRSGRRLGKASLRPAAKILFSRGAHDFIRFGRDAEPPEQPPALPTLAVCAVLGLFAARVQRL